MAYTLQEAFDIVVVKIHEQGQQSTLGGTCRYRMIDETGERNCAVGMLMSEEDKQHVTNQCINTFDIKSILARSSTTKHYGNFRSIPINALMDLQLIHDISSNWETADIMNTSMIDFSIKYELTFNPPEESNIGKL